MGLIDRVKAGAEQAAGRARESVQEAQLRHELGQAYGELGRVSYALLEQGVLADERFVAPAERVRGLEAQLAVLAAGVSRDDDNETDTEGT
ncbi:MAG TPA: hypothetical protein VNC40_01170 [Gaiellaceae bacterium]|nr:hypothetical protein [Gaiellaceae bacterium]